MNVQPEKTSLHKRSIRWLWQLLPAIKLPRSGPLSGCVSRYQATSTFSTPWSARTLEGKPFSSTAVLKSLRTVAALLLQLQCKYMMRLEYPSMPPCITNPHLKTKQTSLLVISHLHKPKKPNTLGMLDYEGRSQSISREHLKACKYLINYQFCKNCAKLHVQFSLLFTMIIHMFAKQIEICDHLQHTVATL